MKYLKKISFMLGTIAMILLSSRVAISQELWSISVKEFQVEKGERIVGFSVKIKSASIYSFPKVPKGWAIKINNFLNDDPPWNTSLDAVAGVGAAALFPKFLEDFLVIEKYSGLFAEKLDIEVRISTTVDFQKEKRKTFKMQDLTLKAILAGKQR